MPVILKAADEKTWLGSTDTNEILSLLKPYDTEEMDAYPISKLVNSPRNEGPEVREKVVG